MTHLHAYKFQKVIKGLFTCADELQLQLAVTRKQCEEISEVMIAIRQNPMTAKNYVLPLGRPRDQAANDQ